jgi:hypothetical protein
MTDLADFWATAISWCGVSLKPMGAAAVVSDFEGQGRWLKIP